jgi:hypothetical protein
MVFLDTGFSAQSRHPVCLAARGSAGRLRLVVVRRQRDRAPSRALDEGQRSHQPREHQFRRGCRRLAPDLDQRSQQQLLADLAAFPIQAYTRDSTGYVLDVTDFFSGDTPGISGLNAAQRRQYQVRRLDPARSYVSGVRSFPINVEVRHVQTFDAAEPPGDRGGGTISLEARQSMILLPKVPMRPRIADERVGYFSVEHINYGLDEQKAATETFITRWRLEPKDPDAYARGEVVDPIKPITYYIDPATPTKWRRYVKEGVESWQKVFEKAGFKIYSQKGIVHRNP